MTIKVKECKNYDPWLVVLCLVLTLSTIGFGLLAVRNAKPFTCDQMEVVSDRITRCTRILIK